MVKGIHRSNVFKRIGSASIPNKGVLIVGSLGIASSVAYALRAGQDINWDWHNYHDYAIYALLHGRLTVDVAPAGVQSFLNPLVYLPSYALRHGLPPPAAAAAMAAFHGLNAVLVWMLARRCFSGVAGRWPALLAVAIGVTAPMTLSEIGTSFADILTSVLVLAALVLMLDARSDETSRFPGWGGLVAGLLMGAAAALKLTNAVFVIGSLAALAMAPPGWRWVVRYLGGLVIGGLCLGGPWAAWLWIEYGSPMFPFYNAFFKAPDAFKVNLVDYRFLPQSLSDALRYPLYWAIGDHRTAETSFRDVRFALLIAAAAVAALVTAQLRQWPAPVWRMFAGFFAASYVVWLGQFAIQRYIITLELISGVALVGSIFAVLPWRRLGLLVATAATVGVILTTQPAEWGHRPWTDSYPAGPLPPALDTPRLYFVLNVPVAFIISRLPAEARFFLLAEILIPVAAGSKFDAVVRDALAERPDFPVWSLAIAGQPITADALTTLRRFGYQLNRIGCVTVPSAASLAVLEFCPLISVPR